ncbi:MAG: ABC transporter ATP-binding protein [Spirochaetaceae bacterium]|nr:MAG: ABC transporter ATP-binding protein [Spirochaetaceae bacterium]
MSDTKQQSTANPGAKSAGQKSSSTGVTARPSRGPGGHGARIEKPRNFRRAIGRLLVYFGKEWPSLIVVSFAIVTGAILQAIAPARLGGAITEHVERTPDAALFVREMLIVVGIFVAGWFTDALNGGFMNRVGNRLVYRLRKDSFAHLQKLSMSFFEKRGLGDVISRVTNDIEMIYNALTNGFANLLGGLVSIVGILVAMVILDVTLSIVVFSLLPVLILVTMVIGRLVRKAFRVNQVLVGRLSTTVNESVSSARLIKAFHKEEDTFRAFEQISAEARAAGARADIAGFAVHPVMRIINGLAGALVIGVGGYLAVTRGGVYSIGLITAFVLYARRFFEPLRQITEVYNLIQSALAGAERVFEILDTPPEVVNDDGAEVVTEIRGDVEFRGVTFGYLPEQTVISDINLEVKSGQVVAIVGPTGAGKTTLVNLLSRFYDVRSGAILIDGRDIRELELHSLRTRMGVVLQEPYFFADTIMNNIKYGNPVATDEQAIEAAVTADADHFIRRLPDAYDTMLMERGANLSEGERQLLAIARAILANPRILVLDEATSSVDSLTEATIQAGLLTLMKGRTSFIIAHRLSTIRNADHVVVLHNQTIIERGTHTELLEAGGFYARLYQMQFEKPEITEDMAI